MFLFPVLTKSHQFTNQISEASSCLPLRATREGRPSHPPCPCPVHLAGEFAALKEVLGDAGQRDVVNNLLSKISTLQSAVGSAEATRRKLHNELVEARGNVSELG